MSRTTDRAGELLSRPLSQLLVSDRHLFRRRGDRRGVRRGRRLGRLGRLGRALGRRRHRRRLQQLLQQRRLNGKINFNDVDWKNVDRSKIKFDRDQFKNIDRPIMRNRVKADGRNNLKSKAAEVSKQRQNALPDRPRKVSDVRKNKVDKA